LGSTLSKTAKASPDSLIGLLADFDKSYEVKYAINKKGTDKYSAAMKIQCNQVVREAFSSSISTDPDLIELNAINGKAFSEGVPDGATPQAGLDQLTKLFTAFTGIAKGALSIRDQAKRNKAIKKFYSNEDNMSKVENSIASIDQAIRSTELGARLQSKEEFRTAWLEFQKALSLSGNTNRYGDNKKLSLAVESLFSAADKIDKVILARTTEHLATKSRIKTIYANSMNDKKIAEEYFTLKEKIDANTFIGQTAVADKQKATVRLNEIEVLLSADLDKYKTAYSAYKTDVNNISTSSRITDSNNICKNVVDSSSKPQPCLLSNSGRALSNSNKKMQYVVLKKWDKMSKEEKSAYWQSVFASVTALNSLNNEIAKFENDKDNFVLLNNILDDLP